MVADITEEEEMQCRWNTLIEKANRKVFYLIGNSVMTEECRFLNLLVVNNSL